MHPLSVFLCVMSAVSAAAFFSEPVIQAIALAFGLAFAVLSGVRRPWLYLLVIPLSVLINPLFSHRGVTVLFFINNSAVTLEAVLAGASAGAMLAALMMWLAAYSRIMTADKHLYLFGRLTPRLGLTFSAALRFVPLFARRCREISAAQRAMGMYSSEAVEDKLKGRLYAFDAAFSWAVENGVTTSASMTARGYGSARRTSYSLFRFKAADAALSALSLASAAVIFARANELRFVFYPEAMPLPAEIPARLAYAVLCAAPVAIEIKERLAWKFSASKISASPITELPVLR